MLTRWVPLPAQYPMSSSSEGLVSLVSLSWKRAGCAAGGDGSEAAQPKRKRNKTDAFRHIGTTEAAFVGMSDKDRRELECEKVPLQMRLASQCRLQTSCPREEHIEDSPCSLRCQQSPVVAPKLHLAP